MRAECDPRGRTPACADGPGLAAAYTGLVRSFFARRCALPEDAEDLAQESLCAVLEAAGRFRGEASASTWVYAICRNTWCTWLAVCDREAKIAAAAVGEAAIKGGAQEEPRMGLAGALGLDLAAAFESLRPSERRLYSLYYVEGRRVREIAAILDRPEGTVKYLLALLRTRIRALLG